MKTPASTASGVLLIDKSGGFTSHDVVARVRRLAGTRKVGHAGTLDPLATGLLILGVNSSTRLLTYIVGLDKEYFATVRFGAATSTDDSEGEITSEPVPDALGRLSGESIETAFSAQRGTITQVPSSVSAIKVDGQRAYARVRAGEDVVLAGRTVTISELELLGEPRSATEGGRDFVDVDVRVVCSSGTYIRAIARDAGTALGVGGHLTSLRRTRIGPFAVSDALTLEELAERAEAIAAEAGPDIEAASTAARVPLLGAAAVATALFPVLDVDAEQATALGHGQRVEVPDDIRSLAKTLPDGGPIAAVTAEGRLLGLVAVSGRTAKSIVNFPPDEYGPTSGDAQ
ncbi:tRNA pseudouridine(55) synthase TruB [Herbiconiux sp. 11R-BC]|uniref:tRNA pseudouridine(55) synthase TruB n=1 Tax=Herbiconiux sp. 11R-BC TaxID=3111637 RepID=UPI003C00EE1D